MAKKKPNEDREERMVRIGKEILAHEEPGADLIVLVVMRDKGVYHTSTLPGQESAHVMREVADAIGVRPLLPVIRSTGKTFN